MTDFRKYGIWILKGTAHSFSMIILKRLTKLKLQQPEATLALESAKMWLLYQDILQCTINQTQLAEHLPAKRSNSLYRTFLQASSVFFLLLFFQVFSQRSQIMMKPLQRKNVDCFFFPFSVAAADLSTFRLYLLQPWLPTRVKSMITTRRITRLQHWLKENEKRGKEGEAEHY